MRVGEATALVLELHHVLRAGHGISPTPRNSLRDGGCPTWIVAVDSASNTSSLTPIFHPPRKRSACTAISKLPAQQPQTNQTGMWACVAQVSAMNKPK
ncbi:hypothetical protein VDGL01_09282 [Verticillium dahliae]